MVSIVIGVSALGAALASGAAGGGYYFWKKTEVCAIFFLCIPAYSTQITHIQTSIVHMFLYSSFK